MKTFLLVIIPTIICFSFNSSFSQEACKVLKPEIADKYEGKCKNGLANGKGVAEGKDKYVGRFKNGLPQGEGKYTWSTGEIYDGSWLEGKKEGRGKLFYKKDGVDSIKIGIWKNDVFFKKIVPNPYSVIRYDGVKRYSASRIGDGDRILFSFKQNNSTASTNNLIFSNSSGNSFSVGTQRGFEKINFPASFKVTFSVPNSYGGGSIDVAFEIEITEPGSWTVDIDI